MATERQVRARRWRKAVWGSLLVGGLLGGWLGGPAEAQGPYTAQITRALRALGLTSGGSPTFGTVTATKVLAGDGSTAAPSYSFASSPTTGVYLSAANQIGMVANGSRVVLVNTTGLLLTGDNLTLSLGAAGDVVLAHDAANTLAQRNGTNAQTFNLYATTNGTDKEYITFIASSSGHQILSARAGAGIQRSMDVGFSGGALLRQDGTNATLFAQNFIFGTDNTKDIGASGANRPRTGYFGTSVIAPIVRSTAQTFASLAACASGIEGTMAAVTDSTTATWGATITGSGANHVLAYCDGTNWTVAGK